MQSDPDLDYEISCLYPSTRAIHIVGVILQAWRQRKTSTEALAWGKAGDFLDNQENPSSS
jgi:hypothetical protein